jgi:hypothetical protein
MAKQSKSTKTLSKAQRSKIARAARFAQLKTMASKGYQRAAAKGTRAVQAYLTKLHAA